MKKIFSLVIIAAVFATAAMPAFADVKAMFAIGLLDYGENCKVLPVDDYRKKVLDYEEYQKLYDSAPTLRDFSLKGWKILHVERVDDKRHLILFGDY